MNLEFIKPTYSAVKSVNGMTGDVVIEIPEADMTGYATEEYVSKKIAEAELAGGDVDLGAYYTKSETNAEIDKAIAAIEHPTTDLTGYATEQFVNDAISQIELTPGPAGKDGQDGKDYILTEADKQEIADMVEVSGGDADLSNYYTKEETETAITNALSAIGVAEEGSY